MPVDDRRRCWMCEVLNLCVVIENDFVAVVVVHRGQTANLHGGHCVVVNFFDIYILGVRLRCLS